MPIMGKKAPKEAKFTNHGRKPVEETRLIARSLERAIYHYALSGL
jgi:hypothetical protein